MLPFGYLHRPTPLALAITTATIAMGMIPSIALAQTSNNLQQQLPSTTVDTIVVTASPLQAQAGDMASATSVLMASDLEQQTASTLGDMISGEAGVSSDTFGQGASRPIIRGQTAPRVAVVQNGLTVQDASQISPDHQVSVPVVGAKQVEIIKGTSALMYGGGAIGGVVNVVDDSIRSTLPPASINGKVTVAGQQATDGYLAYGELVGNIGDNVVLTSSVQKTDQGNIQVPHWDTDEINNSWYTQDNASVGASYVLDDGSYFGASYQRQASEYGLPFHVHNQCKPDANTPNKLNCGGHHHHHHGEPPYVDLKSNVYQLYGEKQTPMIGVDKVSVKASYTDYKHDEIDEGVAGTTFANKALSGRVDATHATYKTGNWGFMKGMVGADINRSEFSAVGLEGYLPKTDSNQVGIYFVERLAPTYYASGINNQDKFASQTNAHAGHDHSHGDTSNHIQNPSSSANQLPANKAPWYVEFGGRQEFKNIEDTQHNISKSYTGTSVSLEGGKYLSPTSQVSARISHTQRLPAPQELFADGAHLATNTWERGNLNLNPEKTNGVELTYRFNNRDANRANTSNASNQSGFDASVTGFYNQTQDYIYAKTQDVVTTGESAGFKLVDYSQTDAKHYGGEVKARYYLNDMLSFGGFADLALIELEDNSLGRKYAPRLAAPRVGGDITAQVGQFDMVLSGYHRFEQDKIADFETNTPSYNMLDAKVVYHSPNVHDYTAFVKVSNILNELAYNHSSYLVEHVPMPERSINAGITYRF
ncbi:TonB-dependent receptor [Psychrobacter pygoscelis]|uniref:TonB-dependent receptor n=1 Tax=Psychrobacter pygoscelis TaxID=2488563 RepID=UPI001F622F9F|nr:TonB-dependent receptor plug domain-containing protein [Psychrobacter pygoscelis]